MYMMTRWISPKSGLGYANFMGSSLFLSLMSISETSLAVNSSTLLFEIRALFLYIPLYLQEIESFSTGRIFLYASKDTSFISIFRNWHSGSLSKGMHTTPNNDSYFLNSFSSRKSDTTRTWYAPLMSVMIFISHL